MIIKKIIEILDDWAPKAYAEEFDNVGLLIGKDTEVCTGVLVSLDCTEAVVDEAINNHSNLIVCFHPIVFSGLKKITGKNYVERVVIKAIQNNISIVALHTRLDNHPQGVNEVLCKRMNLSNTRVLIPKKGSLKKLSTYVPSSHLEHILEELHNAGAGALGKYSECSFTSEGIGRFKGNENSSPFTGSPQEKSTSKEIHVEVVFESHLHLPVQNALQKAHPYETVAFEIFSLDNPNPEVGMGKIGTLEKPMEPTAFLSFVKDRLHTELIRHSPPIAKKIKRVAVLGGSGSFAIENAKLEGADAFITADLKYHQFYSGEENLLLVDVGHYESEQFTKNLIFDFLSKKMPNFAIVLSSTKTNPVNYY
ncbi:MAG: Nif3-like dinuclear metal center hexameric protein [Flavobacteriaceae bacterium]|nr:Nif3-like dinuclear metal center hexameric protein [Flavobacteriaceae bacterium]MDG1911380.1 Nif3-like dinuclear metal center hexameric protein [Flavobacteriaceae bacterium]